MLRLALPALSCAVLGVGAIHAHGRNLVALAAPATQAEIPRFLDDLRSTGEEDPRR